MKEEAKLSQVKKNLIGQLLQSGIYKQDLACWDSHRYAQGRQGNFVKHNFEKLACESQRIPLM